MIELVREKRCHKCGQVKHVSEFHCNPRNKTDGLQSWCKSCSHQLKIQRREAGLEREYHWRRTFGISSEDYRELLRRQGGRCKICGAEDSGNKRQHVFSVDHDHVTGEIRGLLCVHCNHGLGAFFDDTDRLRSAIKYLSEFKNATTNARRHIC